MSTIVPKRLFTHISSENINTFSNLRKKLATYDDRIEIDDNDDKTIAIKDVKSSSQTKPQSLEKNNIKKMLASTMSLSTGTSLSPESQSREYCEIEEISCPSIYKKFSSNQHSCQSVEKSVSSNNRKVIKKTNISNALVIATSNDFYSSQLSCEPTDEPIFPTKDENITNSTIPNAIVVAKNACSSIKDEIMKSTTVSDAIVVAKGTDMLSSYKSLNSMHNDLIIATTCEEVIPHKFNLLKENSQTYVIKNRIQSSFKINDKPVYFQMEIELLSNATKRIFPSGTLFDTKNNLKNLLTAFAVFLVFLYCYSRM